jgi:tubulin---tyrosine ligase
LPASSTEEEWILIDSTPASCVQLGLHHFFRQRGPVDLVISGPNYGRNTTAVFALSSGTLGGALEAAVCGIRAIALSYAFFDRNHDPVIIAGASAHSVRLIEWLANNWRQDVQLYSINVPLVEGVGQRKTLWTTVLQNSWRSGSCFNETPVPEGEDETSGEREAGIRKAEGTGGPDLGLRTETQGEEEVTLREQSAEAHSHVRFEHKHFKWAPRFKDVYDSVNESEPGNDGWAVKEGFTRYVHCPRSKLSLRC